MCRDAASLFACWFRPAAVYCYYPTGLRNSRRTYKKSPARRRQSVHPWIESITLRLKHIDSELPVQQNTWLNYTMETYDEDLSQNAFFQSLQQEHRPIFDRAVGEGWIICIPRCGTFIKSALTEEDFLDHILIPDDELPGTHFHTLTHWEVRLNNKALTVEYDGAKPRTLKLLFEETFYSDDLNKYCVWCIEGLLEQETSSSNDEVPVVTTLKECVDLLWNEVLDKNILKDLDVAVEEFENAHKNLENECLQMQRDLVNMLYSKSLKSLLKDHRLRERTMESRYFLQTVKVAIETYILHGLRRILPQAVSNCTAKEDAKLNKIIKNLHDLEINDFGVRPDLYDGISRGKLELSRLDGNFTVLGKISCLKRAVRSVSQGESSVSSDDLLPVLIFLVVKSGLASWCAQLTFMKQFRYSASAASEADEAGFLVTSLEAAVEHVKSGSLKVGLNQGENKLLNGKEKHKNSDEGNKANGLEDSTELFELVKKGNLTEVQKILSEKVETNAKDVKLCHPLCLCESCERNLSKTFQTDHPGLYSRNDRGLTCLHLACLHGQAGIVEFLLQRGADPNDTDTEGQTGLHCAASRGHQNTLLLLLQANANPNAIDARGNSALHVAADHGHDACVKALLYFAEQTRLLINVSAMNLQGDTALHFASKWGYKGIVEILLEYGADPTSKNRRGQTPMTVAHSSYIAKLLEGKPRNSMPIGPISNGTIHKKFTNKKNHVKFNTALTLPSKLCHRGGITDGMHKIERLFAAVAECDIRLASYYLGLEGPCSKMYISNSDDPKFCHPLCNCDKCTSIEELSYERDSKPPIGINAMNDKGETALHIASAVGCLEIIQLLLDAGAKVNIVTRSDGRSPLHMACMHERVQAVKMLLSCGSCNPDVKDNGRDTPLHLAARAGNVRIVEMLVRHGANHRVRNFNGFTALEEIERIKSDDIFRSLAYSNIAKILKNITVAKTSQ